MRRAPLWALVFVGGCVWPGLQRTEGPSTSLKPFAGPPAGETVGLEVAVLEVPVGDRYVNGGLWESVDEQVVALDRKAALDDNGFRVGLIGGVRPSRFDDLLKSPKTNPNPLWLQTRAGKAKPIALGGQRLRCEFQIMDGDKAGPKTVIDQGKCCLQITPTLAADGGVKLAFLPVVEHGLRPIWSGPRDGEEAPVPGDRYPVLGWEVTAAAGEFVVVGTAFEKAGTLGRTFFIDLDGGKPVQRLLVLRAARTGG